MKDLNENIKKLSEKRTWIRQAFKNFMQEWEKNTAGSDVFVSAPILKKSLYNGELVREYMLCTGKYELYYYDEVYGKLHEYSDNCYSWQDLNISDIKEIIKNLPKAIEEIENEVKEQLKEENTLNFPTFK